MEFQKITIKELAIKMNISCTSAQRLLADIKAENNLKIVTIYHVREYLKIPVPQNVS